MIIDRDALVSTENSVIGKVIATDNVELSFRLYLSEQAKSSIIFYHGGGSSNLSYTKMAEQLRDNSKVNVYLLDIRGHGLSGGERGYAPSKEQIWKDISSAIDYVKIQHPDIPLYLGGHSSGAGLVLNYSAWKLHKQVNQYIMIAPEFGYKIAPQQEKFAKANRFMFMMNTLSGGVLYKKTLAVTFNYSQEQLKDRRVQGYNVNMSRAVIPSDPVNYLLRIDKVTHIFLAEGDEVINNTKLTSVLSTVCQKNSNVKFDIIEKAKHIMILKNISEQIGKHI